MSSNSNASPKGNQAKFYDSITDGWYKADYLGYEGLSEYVVSELLKRSEIKNPCFQFVLYDICSFKIGNKQLTGCYSRNFIDNRTWDWWELTKDNFIGGFRLYLEKPTGADILEFVDHELRVNLNAIDSKVVDAIIQYAIFGKVKYHSY